VSKKPPRVHCDDPSTWRHKDEKIDLPRLLQLIEENGGPEGLDLHGANLSELNARPEALHPYLQAYAQKHGDDAEPPWLTRDAWGNISIDLSFAHLEGANLAFARLQNADLRGARLEKAQLGGARLDNAHLSGAHLESATLWGTHLEHAYLLGACLQDAKLFGAHLQNADVAFADLGTADLRFADLENATLSGADLNRVAWHQAHLHRTRLRHEQLGPAIGDELAARGQIHYLRATFREAREAYLALKTNFDSIGRYDDASWAYVKERRMERAMYFPTTAGHDWIRSQLGVHTTDRPLGNLRGGRRLAPAAVLDRARSAWLYLRLLVRFRAPDFKPHSAAFLDLVPTVMKRQIHKEEEERIDRPRWARNWAYELLTGYGQHWWKPLLWAAVVIAAFTGIYAGAGNIASGDGGGTHNFLTALTHSIGAFATIGFNTLEPVGWGARLLTAMEAMFGIGLFALFVFTLGTRMRRS